VRFGGRSLASSLRTRKTSQTQVTGSCSCVIWESRSEMRWTSGEGGGKVTSSVKNGDDDAKLRNYVIGKILHVPSTAENLGRWSPMSCWLL
jgi:hypothetical protein